MTPSDRSDRELAGRLRELYREGLVLRELLGLKLLVRFLIIAELGLWVMVVLYAAGVVGKR